MKESKSGALQVESSRGAFNIETMSIDFQGSDPNDPLREYACCIYCEFFAHLCSSQLSSLSMIFV